MLNQLLQMIAPVSCVCCGKSAELCCSEHLYEPGVVTFGAIPMHYLTPLDDERHRAMVAFKDQGVTALGSRYACATKSHLRTLGLANLIVVVPPRNPRNYRTRGFHPALAVANKLGLPVRTARARKQLADQRSLSAKDRALNLSGAYELSNLSGEKVLLFDDVMTTGATLRELHRAATVAGGQVTAGCVLAMRFPDFDPSDLKKA
jgi:predicted amidophosphoribosyltransferase